MCIIGYQTVLGRYREMTVEQLRTQCDRKNIIYNDRMGKQTLINRLVTIDNKLKGWASLMIVTNKRKGSIKV